MQELYEEFLNWYELLVSIYKSISPRIAKILTLKKIKSSRKETISDC